MKASTRNLIKGTFHKVKGSVRATLGNSLNSRRAALSGNVERVGGIVQSNFGRIEKICGL
jgi:uncharacterized protein YjbJ (UPF0337 family)